MHANHREDIDQVYSGDIAAAVGLKNTTTGDTLCDEKHQIILESVRVLDKDGNEIELKDDDEDDFIPEMRDEFYAADDEEIEAEGFSIENVPEDELGADIGDDNDYDDEEDE